MAWVGAHLAVRPPAALAASPSAAPSPGPCCCPILPLLPGPYRVPRAAWPRWHNEQLRCGKPRDLLAEAVQDAGFEDCARAPTNTPTVGGPVYCAGLVAGSQRGVAPSSAAAMELRQLRYSVRWSSWQHEAAPRST